MSKFNSPAFKLIVLVSWFWLTIGMIAIMFFLNKGLIAEKARNDRLEKNLEEIEKQVGSGRIILELEK